MEELYNLQHSAYLTIMSIVSGSTFSFWAYYLFVLHPNLAATNYIYAAFVFSLIVISWQEYIIGLSAYKWIFGPIDSLIPFFLGAALFYSIHVIDRAHSDWFFALGIFTLLCYVATRNQHENVKSFTINEAALSSLGRYLVFSRVYFLFVPAFSFAMWGLALVNSQVYAEYEAYAFGVTLFCLGIFIFRTALYWRRFKQWIVVAAE